MKKQDKCVVRQGSIYHVTIAGTDYAMFIWRTGKRFCGRVQGQPQVPEQAATTALAVRDALSFWLKTTHAK